MESEKFSIKHKKSFNINTNPKYSENSMLLKPSYNNTNDREISMCLQMEEFTKCNQSKCLLIDPQFIEEMMKNPQMIISDFLKTQILKNQTLRPNNNNNNNTNTIKNTNTINNNNNSKKAPTYFSSLFIKNGENYSSYQIINGLETSKTAMCIIKCLVLISFIKNKNNSKIDIDKLFGTFDLNQEIFNFSILFNILFGTASKTKDNQGILNRLINKLIPIGLNLLGDFFTEKKDKNSENNEYTNELSYDIFTLLNSLNSNQIKFTISTSKSNEMKPDIKDNVLIQLNNLLGDLLVENKNEKTSNSVNSLSHINLIVQSIKKKLVLNTSNNLELIKSLDEIEEILKSIKYERKQGFILPEGSPFEFKKDNTLINSDIGIKLTSVISGVTFMIKEICSNDESENDEINKDNKDNEINKDNKDDEINKDNSKIETLKVETK